MTITLKAQVHFGVQTQINSLANSGSVVVDSVAVTTVDNKVVLTDKTPQTIGVFIEYSLLKRVGLRTELNFRLGGNDGLGVFITGRKAQVVTLVGRDFVVDIPLTVNYNIIQKEWFPFLRVKNFELGVLGGVDILLQKGSTRDPNFTFGSDPFYRGINDVGKALYDVQNGVNCLYSYGIRLRVSRFVVTYRNDEQLSRSGTSDLKVWGNSYPFVTKWKYSSVSIGYLFHWFDRKSKK